MFTGIIDNLGEVVSLEGRRMLRIKPQRPYRDLEVGESISVNGVCLTLVKWGREIMEFEVSPETLKRTNLGLLKAKSVVNLERALKAGGRFGGHMVLGHVDTTGRIRNITSIGNFRALTIDVTEPRFLKYVVEKGSIAVDGISLTVNKVDGRSFEVMIITHTLLNTNLAFRKPGDLVNIEVDIIGKYVEKLFSKESTEDRLERLLKENIDGS